MKDDISTPTGDGTSPNEFEGGKPGTTDRSRAEAAIEDLRQRGGVFVNAVRATRMPMLLTDPNLPDNPIVFANAAFLKLSGYSVEEVLGQQPHFMNGPDTDPKDAARFKEALRADQDDIVETIQYRRDGSRFVATVLLSAFKDEEGHTLNHFMSWLDVTRRVDAEDEVADLKQMQAALRSTEKRRELALQAAGLGTWDYDLVANLCHFDARAREMYNLHSDVLDYPEGMAAVVHPDDVDPMFNAIHRASDVKGDGRYAIDYRIAQADAGYRWIRAWGQAEFAGEGAARLAVRIIGASRDVTSEMEAEEALRRSEEQLAAELKDTTLLRDLAERLVSEDSLTAIYDELLAAAITITGSDAGTVQIYEPASDSLVLLVTRGLGSKMTDHFRTVDANSRTACGIALRTGERTFVDFDADLENDPDNACAMHLEAGYRSAQATPLLSRTGAPIGMLNTHWHESRHRPSERQLRFLDLLARQAADLIERRQSEQNLRDSERHAQNLLAELQHRVRNMLAVVRSIARHTAERSESVDDMLTHLDGRLSAFARVQSAVTRSSDGSLELQAIIEDELLAVATHQGPHLKIDGPQLFLKGRTAESVSLAIHELATNAIKYGALTVPNGRIRARWRIEHSGEKDRLHFEWTESGLDWNSHVTHEGFGHEMLLRTLPYELEARTNIKFTEDGMQFTMIMPLGPESVGRVGAG